MSAPIDAESRAGSNGSFIRANARNSVALLLSMISRDLSDVEPF